MPSNYPHTPDPGCPTCSGKGQIWDFALNEFRRCPWCGAHQERPKYKPKRPPMANYRSPHNFREIPDDEWYDEMHSRLDRIDTRIGKPKGRPLKLRHRILIKLGLLKKKEPSE
jgi:hypothetical protein